MEISSAIDLILSRGSPFGNESGSLGNGFFRPGHKIIDFIGKNVRILVVGAGGLGCEILKNLALSGFKKNPLLLIWIQ